MRRWRRLFVSLALVFLILLGVLIAAGAWYVHSDHATARVAGRLEAALGAPVKVGGIRLGLRDSSVHQVDLYEPGAETSGTPWLTARDVATDVGIGDLLRDEAIPRSLTLVGVEVRLRFDRAGRLVTRLPRPEHPEEALPDLRIEGGQLTLQQEGRPDMVVRGICGTLRATGDRRVLAGTVADPFWGDWTLDGSLAADGRAGSTALKTKSSIHVTQAMLNDLPFISPAVWKEVQADGNTPVAVTFEFNSPKDEFHYAVALEPQNTAVHVPAIELEADQAHGKVAIRDGTVLLQGVEGRAAGGQIRTDAELDFRGEADKLHFNVRVSGLEVQRLPQSWSMPPVEGRLTGHADLQVTVANGRTQTDGEGEGVIEDARVAGQPAEPIRLKLHPAGEGYRFAAVWPRPLPGGAERVALAVGVVASPTRPTAAAPTARREPIPPPAAPEPPRYLEINLGMKDINLEQFVRGLRLELPFEVAGRLSFQIHAAIPYNTPRDYRAYRFKGTAALAWLVVADLRLEEVNARLTYEEGILELAELRGRVPDGEPSGGAFDGTARLQVVPAGDLTARVSLDRIPVARVLSVLPGVAERAGGAVSGRATFRAPAAQLRDVNNWRASGAVSGDRVEAFGWTLVHGGADFRVENGTLTVSDARTQIEGLDATGKARLGLTAPYRFEGNVDLRHAHLGALRRLAPEVRPPVSVDGRLDATASFQGTLSPVTVESSGTADATGLKMAQVAVGELHLRWANDANRLILSDIKGRLYGGDVTGKATVPLRGAEPGTASLHFRDLDVGGLQKDLPAIPFTLEGKASGSVEGTLPAAGAIRERSATAKVDLEAPRLRVQGIPTERLRGTVDYRRGTVDYRFEGETLGGKFHLDGQLPPAAEPAPPGKEGHLQVEGARLSRVAAELRLPALEPLQGLVNLDVTFRHEGPGWWPVGTGRLVIDGPRWGTVELADILRSQVIVNRDEVRLRDISGVMGEGTLRGQIAWSLRRLGTGWFNLALDPVPVARLLAFWPGATAAVEGTAEVRLRGTLGREWSGTGDAFVSRGRVYGVDVSEWRLPVDFAFAPGSGQGRLEVRESTAQVAAGRVVGRASWGWGAMNRLEGQIRFTGLQLRTLLHQLADLSQSGQGRATGRIDFAGGDVRSLRDLTADLNGSLQQTQALSFPVLSALSPFLPIGPSSTTFTSGDVKARLAGGVVRVQRLGLQSSFVQLFLEGTVTLEGRLSLDVTANTGNGVSPAGLRLLGLRLPATGPIPLSLVVQASSYLANRLVHARVTGTIRSPVIQIEPVALLTQEALTFFVNRAVLPRP